MSCLVEENIGPRAQGGLLDALRAYIVFSFVTITSTSVEVLLFLFLSFLVCFFSLFFVTSQSRVVV